MLSTQPQVFVPRELPYSPIRPDTSVVEGFDRLNQYFQQIQDYKTSTDVMVQTYQFANQLQQQNIDPQTAQQEWDKFHDSLLQNADVDAETRAKLDRYIQLRKVESLAKITSKYHTQQLLDALSKTTAAIGNYVQNVRDVDSYTNAVNNIETQIESAVNAGVLRKDGAYKLQQEALAQARQNLIAAEIDNGKFEDDFKAGVFQKLGIDESTLLKAKQLYERTKLGDMRFAEELEKKRQADMYENLFRGILDGKVGYSDIVKAAQNGLDPRYAVALQKLSDYETSNDPQALQRFHDLINAVVSGAYAGEKGKQRLYEITADLRAKNKLTSDMVLKIYATWDKYEQAQQTVQQLPQIDQHAIKEIGSGIDSVMKNMLAQFPAYSQNAVGLHVKLPDLKQFTTIASAYYNELVNDYIAKHKQISVPTLLTLRQQAVRIGLSPLLKEEIYKNNQDYFEQFKSQYGVSDAFIEKALLPAAQQFALSHGVVIFKNLPGDFVSKEIAVPVVRNKNKWGVSELLFKFTKDGIVPADKSTEQALERIYGKVQKPKKSSGGIWDVAPNMKGWGNASWIQ